MYKNFYYSRKTNTCHLWSDGQHDEPLYQKFQFEPYAYQIDPKGEFKTLTGLKVKKVTSWDKEFEKKGAIFEHDVPIATRVLIDNYFESDEPSIDHRILFFDIEVEKGLRYSSAKDALNTITSIAYYFDHKYVCLLLDRENNLTDCVKEIDGIGKVMVKTFDTEQKLLTTFLAIWNKINPTIISAYNGDYFDVPYLVNRITNVLGWNFTKRLSPIEIVETREFGKDTFIKIAGITQMDYLQLYKKFTYIEESSYSLEAISQKELGRGKMKYEGTLDDLYKNDIDGFIEYNVNDVELMVALDKKMDLIEIARGICHKGHVPYDDFPFSSIYLDGAIATRCKRKGVITISNLSKTVEFELEIKEAYIKIKNKYDQLKSNVLPDKTKIYITNDGEYECIGTYLTKHNKSNKNSNIIIVSAGKAKGAFVKPPKVGKHNWVYSIDIQSLYPNLIITQNNSLETQIGVIKDWDKFHLPSKLSENNNLKNLENFGYLDDNVILEIEPIIHELFSEKNPETLQLSKSEFIEYINKHNATISSAGCIFDTTKKGIIPEILEEWFDERIMYKNQMKKYTEGSLEYVYNDRKQLITKILLNSLYGVLLLPSFRYYSKLSGESVTLSGQSVIKFSDFIINLFYKKKLGNKYKTNCVVYQDSDSAYLDARPLIENFDELTDIERIKKTEQISNEVTEFVNKTVKWLSKHCFNSNNNRLLFNQEKVSKRAFWGQAKKRYAQLSVEVVDGKIKEKIDIKGFDVVRSSFPKTFRKMMKEVIVDILHDVSIDELNQKVRDFKKIYKQGSIFDLMLPTSVKEISKFKYGQKGTPIHVKSAQNYNQLLKLFDIQSVPPIQDGDKIVYAYVKQNPYGFETLGLKGQGEDDNRIVEFMEKYIDKEKVFETALLSKLNTIWTDLGWGQVQLNEPNNFF